MENFPVWGNHQVDSAWRTIHPQLNKRRSSIGPLELWNFPASLFILRLFFSILSIIVKY